MSVMHPDCPTPLDLERLIPESSDGGWRGEREVYEFFQKHMPPDWHVFYNQHLAYGVGPQLDFLVCVPQMGLVNVDAKGAGYQVSPGGQVVWNGKRKDIIHEAARGRNAIDSYMKERWSNGQGWGSFTYLIVFARSGVALPSTALDDGFSILNWRNNARQVAQELTQRIINRLNEHPKLPQNVQRHNRQKFQEYWPSLLHALSAQQTPFTASHQFDVWNHQSELVLSNEQARVYGALRKHRFCHVRGGAGTGKTLIAMLLGRAYAQEDKKVLYVCFNKKLAEYLRFQDVPKKMKITHLHKIHEVFALPSHRMKESVCWSQKAQQIRGEICHCENRVFCEAAQTLVFRREGSRAIPWPGRSSVRIPANTACFRPNPLLAGAVLSHRF